MIRHTELSVTGKKRNYHYGNLLHPAKLAELDLTLHAVMTRHSMRVVDVSCCQTMGKLNQLILTCLFQPSTVSSDMLVMLSA